MTSALAGARNEAQVQKNAWAGDLHLTNDQIALIRDLVEQGWPV